MLRYLLMCSCLLVLINGLSLAEIYKCKDTKGATVYADDPTKLPRDCKQEQIIELPPLNLIPAQATPPAKQSLETSPPAPSPDTEQKENDELSYSSLKDEAESLVKSFESARKGSFRAPLVTEKQKAKRKLGEIRVEKNSLLSKIEASPLAQSQKKEISGILSAITE